MACRRHNLYLRQNEGDSSREHVKQPCVVAHPHWSPLSYASSTKPLDASTCDLDRLARFQWMAGSGLAAIFSADRLRSRLLQWRTSDCNVVRKIVSFTIFESKSYTI